MIDGGRTYALPHIHSEVFALTDSWPREAVTSSGFELAIFGR